MLVAERAVGRAERLEGLRGALLRDVRLMREVQVRIGRTLLEIGRLGDSGATTYPMLCEAVGLSPVEGRELLALAEASWVKPEVESRFLEGRITPQKAAVVNELVKHPELQKPGEDLLAFVETTTARDLRDEVNRRKEEARTGRPPVGLTLQVSARGHDSFRRCGVLVSRHLGHIATEGETLETVSEYFLDREDPERKARRLEGRDSAAAGEARPAVAVDGPLTAARATRSRHIPARDTRDLVRVCGDRCWVTGCSNRVFLDRCHRRAFRSGGSNRLWNLLHLCREHHAGLDLGEWRLSRRRDGVWILIPRSGFGCEALLPEAGRFLDETVGAVRERAPP